MTPDEVMAEVKSGQARPLYLVVGEEQYLVERVIAALRATVVGGGLAQFNEERLVAGETDADRVISAARTVPMMAKQRLIVVRSLERWESRSQDPEAGESDNADTGRAGPLIASRSTRRLLSPRPAWFSWQRKSTGVEN